MSARRDKKRRKARNAARDRDPIAKTTTSPAARKLARRDGTPPRDGAAPRQARSGSQRLLAWAFDPQPLVRLEVIRIAAPLAILGFMAARIAHPDDWLSDVGFRIPDLGGDWRQPVAIPPVPLWAAYAICLVLVTSGLAVAAGAKTRIASAIFAATLCYVALADRLAAFTVSKLAPIIALALCLTPSGTRYSVDGWWRRRRGGAAINIDLVSGGCVRFFQLLLPVFYMSSGLCKAKNEWLSNSYVLWSHVHDSYQTSVSWWLGNHMPQQAWPVLQGITLVFEIGAPLWFSNRFTRPFALAWGVGMHAMIGLMFGPVIWFSLLMIILLVASYAPSRWLERALGWRPRAGAGELQARP
jgi:uncharacterized membrane protein YphA (DoxX/SURF4 family)